jgi:hypothetical protein
MVRAAHRSGILAFATVSAFAVAAATPASSETAAADGRSAHSSPRDAVDNVRERSGADTPAVEVSLGLALLHTSCYQLADGGPRCRGSFEGERATGCGLRDGCDLAYGGFVLSLASYVHRHIAIAGDVALYAQVELSPTDQPSSLAVGPRVKVWGVRTGSDRPPVALLVS